VVGTSTIRSPD